MTHSGANADAPDASARPERIVLHLYVSGTTALSAKAIINVRKVCEEHLKDRYELKVLDVARHPELAMEEDLIALPTLVRKFPAPARRFIGDLSDTAGLLARLTD
jgi:circadian clock protein KaiB